MQAKSDATARSAFRTSGARPAPARAAGSPSRLLEVNADRLWGSLLEMARIGALPAGGCCRTALSKEDGEGRQLFVRWCEAAGCTVRIDRVGNIFARRAGTLRTVDPVGTGSHLDTQPHGGKFDGAFGVLAGLEVIRTLNDARIATAAPIELVVWTNEEAARFGPPLTGSSAFVGSVDEQVVLATATVDGTTVEQDLRRIGFLGDEPVGRTRFSSFIEAHIEQGPLLEQRCSKIGVVTRIQAIRFFRAKVVGLDAHAGTTPMDRRKDALLGTAKMIVQLTRLARGLNRVATLTVGQLNVIPNSGSTIAGEVIFTVDMRHPEEEVLDCLENASRQLLSEIAERSGLSVELAREAALPPLDFSRAVARAIRRAARRLGYPHMDIASAAGHDAMNLARVTPTGMIFVPCKDGISHNELESALPADLAAGATVLLHAIIERAGVP